MVGVLLQLHWRHRCAQPIPSQAAAGVSSRGDRRGKGPLCVATPSCSDAESDDEADVNVYLNTTMFTTQAVRKFYN
jgi:hypothetical protein